MSGCRGKHAVTHNEREVLARYPQAVTAAPGEEKRPDVGQMGPRIFRLFTDAAARPCPLRTLLIRA